ncbi:hypothetical protein CWO91_11360 [Bradyrhizobium genosp. SA-3]|uniref:hypothetical protein n=1 Tax=Bradyrhizobium genosp. SA-3 TaxID=508868 RepID=UPI001029239B|nr:hypothetical protein [Bradyrhizobium genosp. SA-3]RZN10792.1 hypothetical protein CWO91_11360 [Bradyrhizobium genosp. SA-3]
MAPALYLARPRGETFVPFHARIVAEEKYPFGRAVLSATLKYAGVLPQQVARRQKKKHVGIKRKVENRGCTVKEMGRKTADFGRL